MLGRMREPIVVMVSVPSREVGEKLAEVLVSDGLAACVNVMGEMRSIYSWQGKIEREQELLCIIKSTRDAFEALRARVVALHPYQVPEVLALPVSDGHAPYLEWLFGAVTAGGG
jgi:periplasmic divalent cation tolerance protein